MHSSLFQVEVVSVPDPELSVLGGGKKWENLLSPSGLVSCRIRSRLSCSVHR